MPEQPQTIENLMKVSLAIRTGDAPAEGDTGSPFEFIYGVGSSGITPFEKALFGKGVGDRIQFNLAPTDCCETVGHLELPLRQQTGIRAPAVMQISITGVVRPQDREVISAMAAGGGCGDCDCGCH